MNPRRVQQTERHGDLPPLVPPSMQPGQAPDPPPPDTPELARLAGALAALAARVERLSEDARPKATREQRLAALEKARAWLTDLGVHPGADRIHAELAVARYLTGE